LKCKVESYEISIEKQEVDEINNAAFSLIRMLDIIHSWSM